jgi:uncharacterized protein (DUF1697 family)
MHSSMRQIALLRGINLGPNRRVSMPDLRSLLEAAGFEEVRTYVQSGNVVLSSDAAPDELASECERRIADRFGFDVDVIVRTRDELAEVVRRDPLGDVAVNPKLYQVSFLSAPPDPDRVRAVAAQASGAERCVAIDREVYAWHPDGIGRSRLSAKLAGGGLGVTSTSRNWATVTTLLAMALQ